MFESLIKKITKSLSRLKIPYVIIGGQAVLLYGIPRLTKDIDITLGVDTDNIPLVKKLCGELGLKILPKNADEFAAKTMVLPAEDTRTGIRVDFIFSFSDYEKEAIRRAVKVKIEGYAVCFASAEDLIIHKIFAGRAVDLEDVKNVVVRRGLKKINVGYIQKWLKKLQPLDIKTNMVSLFKQVIKDAKR